MTLLTRPDGGVDPRSNYNLNLAAETCVAICGGKTEHTAAVMVYLGARFDNLAAHTRKRCAKLAERYGCGKSGCVDCVGGAIAAEIHKMEDCHAGIFGVK